MSKIKTKERKADNRRMAKQAKERKALIDDNTGLTPCEVKELLEYIQENHSWEHSLECVNKHGNPDVMGYPRIVKYVRMSMDTRTGDVWHVGLDDDNYRTENGYNLKERVYWALSLRTFPNSKYHQE